MIINSAGNLNKQPIIDVFMNSIFCTQYQATLLSITIAPALGVLLGDLVHHAADLRSQQQHELLAAAAVQPVPAGELLGQPLGLVDVPPEHDDLLHRVAQVHVDHQERLQSSWWLFVCTVLERSEWLCWGLVDASRSHQLFGRPHSEMLVLTLLLQSSALEQPGYCLVEVGGGLLFGLQPLRGFVDCRLERALFLALLELAVDPISVLLDDGLGLLVQLLALFHTSIAAQLVLGRVWTERALLQFFWLPLLPLPHVLHIPAQFVEVQEIGVGDHNCALPWELNLCRLQHRRSLLQHPRPVSAGEHLALSIDCRLERWVLGNRNRAEPRGLVEQPVSVEELESGLQFPARFPVKVQFKEFPVRAACFLEVNWVDVVHAHHGQHEHAGVAHRGQAQQLVGLEQQLLLFDRNDLALLQVDREEPHAPQYQSELIEAQPVFYLQLRQPSLVLFDHLLRHQPVVPLAPLLVAVGLRLRRAGLLLFSLRLLALSSQRIGVEVLVEGLIPRHLLATRSDCRHELHLFVVLLCVSICQRVLGDVIKSLVRWDVGRTRVFALWIDLRLERGTWVILLHHLLQRLSLVLGSVDELLLTIQELLECSFLGAALVHRRPEGALLHLVALLGLLPLFQLLFFVALELGAALDNRKRSGFVCLLAL